MDTLDLSAPTVSPSILAGRAWCRMQVQGRAEGHDWNPVLAAGGAAR